MILHFIISKAHGLLEVPSVNSTSASTAYPNSTSTSSSQAHRSIIPRIRLMFPTFVSLSSSYSNQSTIDLLKPVQKLEHARLGRPLQARVVQVLQPKPHISTLEPLEVVEDGPAPGTRHVDLFIVSSAFHISNRIRLGLPCPREYSARSDLGNSGDNPLVSNPTAPARDSSTGPRMARQNRTLSPKCRAQRGTARL